MGGVGCAWTCGPGPTACAGPPASSAMLRKVTGATTRLVAVRKRLCTDIGRLLVTGQERGSRRRGGNPTTGCEHATLARLDTPVRHPVAYRQKVVTTWPYPGAAWLLPT